VERAAFFQMHAVLIQWAFVFLKASSPNTQVSCIKNRMEQFCIYCGEREATTKDHVPPKSFFRKPRPANLITVPCCKDCNGTYGIDDERVRNLITSIDTTEDHPAIQKQIAEKRDRSYSRKEGQSNFQHIIESVRIVDRYSPGGIYFGKAPAFDLNQKVMDRFIERMTRALLYYENGIEYTEFEVEWKKSPDLPALERMPPELRTFLLNGQSKEIGDGIFRYVGYYTPGRATSLWLLNFYGGIEFMSIVREKR
jgi:hypothetical protein